VRAALAACFLLAAVLVVACGESPAHAKPPSAMRGPGPLGALRPPLGTGAAPDYLAILREAPASGATAPFLAALDWYRTVLSPLDGNRCVMAPTCSLYAQQAFREHGTLLGFVLTADRLLHESDEQPLVRSYVVRGQRHYLDPLSANTYWLPDWMR
jgi:hypothetical protein